MDYITDQENHIACSALVVTGLHDRNVTTRHADLMVEAFRKAGKPVKLVLHQGGHMELDRVSINGTPWEELMNTWLSHYLFGVENDAELLPEVIAQNNITGVFEALDHRPGTQVLTLKPRSGEERTTVTSEGMDDYSIDFQAEPENGLIIDDQEDLYSGMPPALAAVYRFDLPAGTTIQGTPELHALLDSDREDLDGIMITAVLMDVSGEGVFPTYSPTDALRDGVGTVDLEDQLYDSGYDVGLIAMRAFRQTDKPRKIVSFAWTDLQNPGCGKKSSEYVLQEVGLISGAEQEYTFYFLPTVYTVAEGHHLELILLTWDPSRVQLDAWFNLDGSLETTLDDSEYTMTINNGSLSLVLPAGSGDPDWMTKTRGTDGIP